MAIVDKVTDKAVVRLKGRVDFYTLRGLLPVARKWPKKPTPPYTEEQAEAQECFRISRKVLKFMSPEVQAVWKGQCTGKRKQWPDQVSTLFMRYFKVKKTNPQAVTHFVLTKEADFFYITWTLRLDIPFNPDLPIITELRSEDFYYVDLEPYGSPLHVTVYDEDGIRIAAPFIQVLP